MLQPNKRIDSYQLTMAPMTPAHLDRLRELSMSVSWPHRPQDWQMIMDLGEGVVALDEIGRLVSSAMVFPMGPGLVNIGMVITSPRLQDQGTGRWMMDEMLARTEGNVRLLNATKAAYRLYLSLGFQPVARVWQQQGVARQLAGGDDRVRALGAADHGVIAALDAAALGGDRLPVLRYALAHSEGSVLEENGQIAGYALCRPFGRGHVIGPVVARSEDEAVALIRPLINAHAGQFMRLDTRYVDGPLRAALEESGLVFYDNVTTMSLGQAPVISGPYRIFGLLSQAFS